MCFLFYFILFYFSFHFFFSFFLFFSFLFLFYFFFFSFSFFLRRAKQKQKFIFQSSTSLSGGNQVDGLPPVFSVESGPKHHCPTVSIRLETHAGRDVKHSKKKICIFFNIQQEIYTGGVRILKSVQSDS